VSRWHVLYFLEEAVYSLQSQSREHLLDQVVDGSHHLFVLAELALPDQLNDAFVKEIITMSAQEFQKRPASLNDFNVRVRP